MKKTLKSLQEEIVKLKKVGEKFITAIKNREVSRPYHYQTNVKEFEPGTTVVKAIKTNMIQVSELHAHVATAGRLGFETLLEADDNGRLQVVFVKKLPPAPIDFLY